MIYYEYDMQLFDDGKYKRGELECFESEIDLPPEQIDFGVVTFDGAVLFVKLRKRGDELAKAIFRQTIKNILNWGLACLDEKATFEFTSNIEIPVKEDEDDE